MLSIGIGAVFALCFMVPLIGGIIASFACIVSVVAATIKIEQATSRTKQLINFIYHRLELFFLKKSS